MNRSTSTDGLTSTDHAEPSVSHTDVVSSTAAHYYVPSSKPVCSCPSCRGSLLAIFVFILISGSSASN